MAGRSFKREGGVKQDQPEGQLPMGQPAASPAPVTSQPKEHSGTELVLRELATLLMDIRCGSLVLTGKPAGPDAGAAYPEWRLELRSHGPDAGDGAGDYRWDGRWPAVPLETMPSALQHRPPIKRGHQLQLGDWVLTGAGEVAQVVQVASPDGPRPALIRPMQTADKISIGPYDVITAVTFSPVKEAVPPVDTSVPTPG